MREHTKLPGVLRKNVRCGGRMARVAAGGVVKKRGTRPPSAQQPLVR